MGFRSIIYPTIYISLCDIALYAKIDFVLLSLLNTCMAGVFLWNQNLYVISMLDNLVEVAGI